MVETEVAKSKANMEIENVALCKKFEIEDINYQAIKNNYKTIIGCTWILIVMYLCMGGSASKGVLDYRCDRMLLQ
jgi:hypothetical protein